jgi:hypothetical protein
LTDVAGILQRIHELLQHHPGDSSTWVASVMELCENDETLLYRTLNSKRMWGGANSIANQALADNPGLDELVWQAEIREFRELMIELGSHLRERGDAYPDIASWLLAFSNWNQSGV